jgi:toxin ParE1/3/4
VKIVDRHPAADQDIEDLAHYIGLSNPRAAGSFLESVTWTCNLLSGMPRAGRTYRDADSRLTGMRLHPVRDFPKHLIFYLPTGIGIEVVRVIHGARDLPTVLRRTQ